VYMMRTDHKDEDDDDDDQYHHYLYYYSIVLTVPTALCHFRFPSSGQSRDGRAAALNLSPLRNDGQ